MKANLIAASCLILSSGTIQAQEIRDEYLDSLLDAHGISIPEENLSPTEKVTPNKDLDMMWDIYSICATKSSNSVSEFMKYLPTDELKREYLPVMKNGLASLIALALLGSMLDSANIVTADKTEDNDCPTNMLLTKAGVDF